MRSLYDRVIRLYHNPESDSGWLWTTARCGDPDVVTASALLATPCYCGGRNKHQYYGPVLPEIEMPPEQRPQSITPDIPSALVSTSFGNHMGSHTGAENEELWFHQGKNSHVTGWWMLEISGLPLTLQRVRKHLLVTRHSFL